MSKESLLSHSNSQKSIPKTYPLLGELERFDKGIVVHFIVILHFAFHRHQIQAIFHH